MRKRTNSRACAGINFNGRTVRDPADIVSGWGEYFDNLYNPQDRDVFDNEWRDIVENNARCADIDIQPDKSVVVFPDTVLKLINSCPRGKSGGDDGLQYEHLIHGKCALAPILANLFTQMLRTGYIPYKMKRGVKYSHSTQRF